MPHDSDQKLAPITFLLGASTAGKTSICNEIMRQSQENADLNGKVEIWGQDQESKVLFDKLGLDMFKDDTRFTQVTEKLSSQPEALDEVLTAVYGGNFKDYKSGKSLSLKEEEFNESIDEFLKDTEGRYDAQTMSFLKEIAQEEMQNGKYQKAIIDLCTEPGKITKSAIDHAIRNSENGIATILDGVPLGFMRQDNPSQDHRIIEKMEEYLDYKEFNGPTQVALVHLHPKEMSLRMQQRNTSAESEGGSMRDRRDGLEFYEAQYSQLFGKVSNDGALLDPVQKIYKEDIYDIAANFGNVEFDGDEIKIRNLKKQVLSGDLTLEKSNEAQIKLTSAIEAEGKKILDAMGFKDGEDSLEIGTKVRSDVIFDHQNQSTSEISSQIIGFISQNMGTIQTVQDSNSVDKFPDSKPKAKEAEDIIPSGKSWVERISDSKRAKDDSEIVR